MEKISNEEPKLFRCQCKKCYSFLSYPFKYDGDETKIEQEIKISRYKGDNINYHSENNFFKKNKILYSFIFCLKCHEKVGYWISQAGIKQKENINKLFFFPQYINMIKYDKNYIKEEEDKKFKQEEFFYESKYLTKEIEEYAKEHIDNFIRNVEILEKERNDSTLCYQSFDRKILTLKNLFYTNVKDRENSYNLGIDFSKEEISNAKKRKKLWNNKDDKLEDSDIKSNGKKNLNNINDGNEENLNSENNNEKKNEEKIINNKDLNKNPGSDIYLSNLSNISKINSNNKESPKINNKNKEPSKINKKSKGPSRDKSKNKKNKRKRK